MSNLSPEMLLEAYKVWEGYELTDVRPVRWLGSLTATLSRVGAPEDARGGRVEIEIIEPGGLTLPNYITGPAEGTYLHAAQIDHKTGEKGRLVIQRANGSLAERPLAEKSYEYFESDEAYFIMNTGANILTAHRTISRVQDPAHPNIKLHPMRPNTQQSGGKVALKNSYKIPFGISDKPVTLNRTFKNTYDRALAERLQAA